MESLSLNGQSIFLFCVCYVNLIYLILDVQPDPSSLEDPADTIMTDFDHDRVIEAKDDKMEFGSHLSDRLSVFTASVKWDDQGQAAFPPIPVIPTQDKGIKDQIIEIKKDGSNASSTLCLSNPSQNGGGTLLAPGDFPFSFVPPPLNSSVVGSTASADGSTLPMDVCLSVSDTKTPVTKQHPSPTSGPIAYNGLFRVPAPEREQPSIAAESISDKSTSINHANLFQVPPPSAPHKRVVTRPSFQIPLPSGPDDPGVLPPNADTPAAVKLPETQGVIVSSLFQLLPPSAPDHRPLFQLPPSAPEHRPLFQLPPSAPDHRPSFQLPASTPDHRPLFQLPPSAPKSQQDGAQRLFNVPTASTLCNAVAAELNADNMAMVQDTNVGKEENLPPSPFRIPSPKLRAEAQPKLRYPPGLDPSTGEFTELLTELASNLSTPAGILRGHANSLRRSHHETSQRMAENLKTRAVLTNLVTHLQAVIILRRRSIFQEHFPRN